MIVGPDPKNTELDNFPHRFALSADGLALIDQSTGYRYNIARKLEGRGQSGLANFYHRDGDSRQLLIKEDDAATCLLEGTAGFVLKTDLLPQPLFNVVNYAKAGFVLSADPARAPMAVSVQNRVMPTMSGGKVVPWDELVYGRKRNPKTLWSEESWGATGITDSIYKMTSDVRWSLAGAIFSSVIAGDESLHVGQYMAILDDEDNLIGIKRIDLGARERYAKARSEKADYSPFNCSHFYQSSGQFGKDYLAYLMAEPSLKKQYMLLWARLNQIDTDVLQQQILSASQNTILRQIEVFPEALQAQALADMLTIINKGAETPIHIDNRLALIEQAKIIAVELAKLDLERLMHMKAQATKAYQLQIEQQCEKIHQSGIDEIQEPLIRALKTNEALMLKSSDMENILLQMSNNHNAINKTMQMCFENIKREPEQARHLDAMILICDTAIDSLETQKCLLMKDPLVYKSLLGEINQKIEFYHTMLDSAQYCRATSSKIKQQYAKNVMFIALSKGSVALKGYLANNVKMIEDMTREKSILGGAAGAFGAHKPTGYYYLDKLFHRYGIPHSKLGFTEYQANLLEAMKQGNTLKVRTMLAHHDFTLDDVTKPDKFGMSLLHYLMRDAKDDAAYASICMIIKVYTQQKMIQSLDYLDGDGCSPYHMLMQNPNRDAIEQEVARAKIMGWRSQYLIKDCFNTSLKNNHGQTPSDLVPDSSSRAGSSHTQ